MREFMKQVVDRLYYGLVAILFGREVERVAQLVGQRPCRAGRLLRAGRGRGGSPASDRKAGVVTLEHLSIRLGVARVCEISFAFFFGNPFEKRGDCSPKLLNSARLHFA